MAFSCRVILILLLPFVFITCGDDAQVNVTPNEPESDFRYPVKPNSLWYYSTYNFVTNLRPDSLRNIFSADTVTGFGIARFSSDTVINADTFSVLRNTHSSEGHDHTTIELYRQNDSGLFRHAFYSSGTNFGPFRNSGYILTAAGRQYTNVYELLRFAATDAGLSDTVLTFDDPPVKALQFPIVDGTEWNYLDYGATKIRKQYYGFENISAAGGNFFCAIVKRKWYFNNSASHDTNFVLTDHFSDKGMISRKYAIKNVLVSNNLGEPIGHIDVVENASVNFLNLP